MLGGIMMATPATGRRRRRIWRYLAGLLVVVIVLLALAPTLAGWLGRGYAQDAIDRAIPGSIDLKRLRLSWRGPQTLGPLILKDPSGATVATVEITASAGLLGLATGGYDLGNVRLTGVADVVADSSGTTNLERAIGAGRSPTTPSGGPAAPSQPFELPPSLAARFVIEQLDITYTDPRLLLPGQPAGGAAALRDVAGSASFAVGKPIDMSLSAGVFTGPTATDARTPAGRLDTQWQVGNLTDAQGRLTPKAAVIDGSVEAKDVPVALADAALEQDGVLVAALGRTMTVRLAASGSAADLRADLTASSPTATADIGLHYTPAAVEISRKGTIKANTGGLASIIPGLSAGGSTTGTTMEVEMWPRIEVSIDSLRVPLAGSRPDLANAGAKITLSASEGAGRILLAGAGDEEPAARAVRLRPLTATLETRVLAERVSLKASTSALIDGRKAGDLSIDVSATDLFQADAAGSRTLQPAGAMLDGVFAISGFNTQIAQPFVHAMGVRLSHDVGPELDLEVTALARRDAESRLPETSLDLRLASKNITGAAEMSIKDGVARTTGDQVRIEVQAAGPLVTRLVLESGLRIQTDMPVTITMTDVSLNLTRALGLATSSTSPVTDLRGAAGTLTLQVGQTSGIIPLVPGRPASPFAFAQTTVTLDTKNIAQGLNLRTKLAVEIDGTSAGSLDVVLAAGGLLDAGGGPRGVPAGPFRGRITGRGISTSLLQSMAPALELARLDLPADLGPAADVTAVLSPATEQGASGLLPPTNVEISLKTDRFTAQTAVIIAEGSIAIADSSAELSVTPAGAESLLTRFAPDRQPRPKLRSPVKVGLTLDGFAIPRDGTGAPDLTRAGAASFGATIPGRVLIDQLAAPNPDGSAPALAAAGIEGLSVKGSVPLAAFTDGAAGEATATVTSNLLDADGGVAGRLDAAASARLASGGPNGPVSVQLKIKDAATQWADVAAGRPGLVSGLLGDAADLDIGFSGAMAPPAPGKPAELRDGALTAGVSSPAISVSSPATIVIHPDRFELSKPLIFKAAVKPEWANTFLLPPAPARDGAAPRPPAATFAKPAEVTVNVPSLVIARGAGPMKPGVFALRAIANIPSVPMTVGDGMGVTFSDAHLDVSGGAKPGVLGFSLRMIHANAGANGAEPVEFVGGLHGVADDQGHLTIADARITAKGSAPRLNTSVIDALARQNGLLPELLGPVVSLNLELSGFSRTAGNISAVATSPRARAAIRGKVDNGVLIASAPATAELREVTPELSERLVRQLPLVGTFEKRPEDGPATFTATNLTAPLDNDLTKLNGDIVVDFGIARFDTSPAFGAIVKALSARESVQIGRQLEPLHLTIRNGVVSYDRYALPLGEFTIHTRGSVNLTARTLDVITYIPLGAVTDEAAGVFNTGLGGLLGRSVPFLEQATMLPWRTRGSLSNPSTAPDVSLFLEEAGRNLLNPGGPLTDELKRLLEDLSPGGGK
jgi:hypothetical protein